MLSPFQHYDPTDAGLEWPHLSRSDDDASMMRDAWQSALDYLNNEPDVLTEALVGEHYGTLAEMNEADRRLLLAVAEDDAQAVLNEIRARLEGYVVRRYYSLINEHRDHLEGTGEL